jgi:hypothetical protein
LPGCDNEDSHIKGSRQTMQRREIKPPARQLQGIKPLSPVARVIMLLRSKPAINKDRSTDHPSRPGPKQLLHLSDMVKRPFSSEIAEERSIMPLFERVQILAMECNSNESINGSPAAIPFATNPDGVPRPKELRKSSVTGPAKRGQVTKARSRTAWNSQRLGWEVQAVLQLAHGCWTHHPLK